MSSSSAKVNYYVPEPAETRSIMEILADLSVSHPKEYEEAVEALIAEKGEEWFKNIKYDWSINGRPKQFMPEPRDAWRILVWLAGRGFGKDLNPLTPTLTANRGWTTLGDLQVGDYVFDESGKPTKVLATYDTEPSKCYRLYFDDGTFIESSSTHLWTTWTHRDRKQYQRYSKSNTFPDDWAGFVGELYDSHKNVVGTYGPTVKQTQEIIDTFTTGKRKDINHCIPNTKPLQFQQKDLLVDPLVVGLYIGDGISSSGDICGEPEDIKYISKILEARGHIIEHIKITRTVGKGLAFLRVKGLKKKLKQLNLIYNKHIPEEYLFSSPQQRLDLLKGLYTTDGTVDKNGTKCEFSQSNYNIAKDVLFLIRSLGMKGRMVSRIPTLNNVPHKRNWRVYAVPTMDIFILPRKSKRLNFSCSQMLKRRHRMICKYEEIPPIPMRCITVDSPNSLWLAGEQLIPTHNTRTGSETIKQVVEEWTSPDILRIGLVGPTAAAVNNIMVGGDAGILSVYAEKDPKRPRWVSTQRKLYWYNDDGTVKAIAELISGEEPERLRGFQFHFAWVDELAAFRYQNTWDMLMFCMRLGDNPQVVVTTTPKPIPILLDILKLPGTWTIKGSSYENRSNLAANYFTDITAKYAGTALGRQELEAEIIEEIPNALWTYENLEKYRINYDEMHKLPEFLSVVLAIDPAAKSTNKSAETGMCVAAYGDDDHFYVLHLDGTKEKPEQWAKRAIKLFEQYSCDRMVAEVNNGGDLVEAIIKSVNPLQQVYGVHASRGKVSRAEPISSLYAQGKVHHVGAFPEGEQQMISFSPIHNPYGLKDKCLIAGTKISTDNGDVNIEDVQVGDKVLTRKGYKNVLASKCTNPQARVLTVTFSNGKTLTGTQNHPVFLYDGSIKEIGDLNIGDEVDSVENNIWQREKKLSLTEMYTEDTQMQSKYLDEDTILEVVKADSTPFIGRCINIITERFRKGFMSIIRMGTTVTTPQIIWKLYQDKSTRRCTVKRGLHTVNLPNNWSTLPLFALLQQGGILAQRVGNGTLSMEGRHIHSDDQSSKYATAAERSMKILDLETQINTVLELAITEIEKKQKNTTSLKFVRSAAKNFTITNTTQSTESKPVPVNVVGISEEKLLQPVYNLTVEEDHEYYANGILTHNCDALVWALTYLVDLTRSNSTYAPAVGGSRQKLNTYKQIFKY